MKFLLIDNTPEDRERIIRLLEKKFYGSRFETITGQKDFVAAMDKGDFDMVITDYLLGWTNGLWVLRKIKDVYPLIPVIMVTGSGNEEVAVEGMKNGLSDYILKRHLYRLPGAVKTGIESVISRRSCNSGDSQLNMPGKRRFSSFKAVSEFAYEFRVEADGTFVCECLTEAFTHITEYSLDELDAYGGWFNIIHPEDISIFMQQRSYLLSGQWDISEFRIIAKSGEILWLRNHAHPVWDTEGNRVVRIYGTAQDITKHKQYEDIIRDTEAIYYKLIETANDAIFIIDAETGIIISTNQQAEYLLGYPRNEITGMHYTQIYPEEEIANYIRIFEECVRSGGKVVKKLAILRKNGLKIPVEICAGITFLRDKKIIQAIFRDITESEKVNEELKIFKILFSEIRDLAYICDTNGNILYVNKIFEKFTGHKPEKFYGNPFAPLFDEENLRKAIDIHTRTVKGESLQFELQFKDTGIVCEYRNLPLKDKKGNVFRTIGIARDITERKRTERALQESEMLYRLLFENSPNPIWIIDRETYSFLAVNKAAVLKYGYSCEEFMGDMTVKDICLEEDIPCVLDYSNNKGDSSALVFTGTCKHRMKGGKVKDVKVTGNPVSFNGRCAVLILVQDVA